MASSMIRDGSVVAFDAGVSIQSVASCVSDVKNVTFVTNSISIASILLNKFHSGEISGRIIFIGGELDIQNRFSKGAFAASAVTLPLISTCERAEHPLNTAFSRTVSFSPRTAVDSEVHPLNAES